MIGKRQVNEYDVIVFGSGLAGLVSATALARKNLLVLILKERKYQSAFLRDGYRFVPFSNLAERRLKASLLSELSRGLGLSLPGIVPEEEHPPQYSSRASAEPSTFQVILPKARVDLFRQKSLFRKEWKREFPGEVAQIQKLYDDLQPLWRPLTTLPAHEEESPFPLRWLRSLLGRLLFSEPFVDLSLFSEEFREFVRLQLISWGGFCSDRFPVSLAAYLLLQHESTPWVSSIDIRQLNERMFDHYLHCGGKVEEIESVEKVFRSWRKGFALRLGGNSRIIRSKFLILNSPLHRVADLQERRGRRLARWAKKIVPQYACVPLFVGVREKVIPVGMKDLLVSISDFRKDCSRGNVLFIALSRKGDETAAPGGKRAITVESLVPVGNGDETSWVEHQKGVMKHLEHLFPFLERYVEFTDWSWAEDHQRCWSYPHFLYGTTSDFNWRDGVVPPRISKNLYFTGKENFPCLGLEGEVLGGWRVVQQILKKYPSG